MNVGTIFQYQIINWAIPIIICTPPVEEPWNFQGRGCINLGISRGEGALTLEFPGERCINIKFPGEGVHEPWNFQGRVWINPGISREGGIQDLEFQGEE